VIDYPDRAPAKQPPTSPARPMEPERKPYVTPRLTEHGSLSSRTLASSLPLSDRALKERSEAVDRGAILARLLMLPIERWSYKGEPARHLGPMAQDFAAAFGLGADDRHIFPLDAAGAALAAIQGLHDLVQAQRARLEALERQVAALRTGAGTRSVREPDRESVGVG
jgi:hypothetical protein